MLIVLEKNVEDSDYDHYLSIGVILKDEKPYIDEWIEYHRMLGVSKFYVFDNESTDNIRDHLRPYIKKGIVDYRHFPGKMMQRKAYKIAVKKAYSESRWLALIDVDEFIVPKTDENLTDYLKKLEPYPAIEMNWVTYGSSGKATWEDGMIIERFKDHSIDSFPVNRHVKSILNPRLVRKVGVHASQFIADLRSVNADLDLNFVYFMDRYPVYTTVQVNHYFTKSAEEFKVKCKKGRVFVLDDLDQTHFDTHDRNEIKYDPIMDKYISRLKDRLKQRDFQELTD